MERHISQEKALSTLENSILGLDFINHFLDSKSKQRLVNDYVALHAQLNEGDKLTIEAKLNNYDVKNLMPVPTIAFDIVLYLNGTNSVVVQRYDSQGVIFYNDSNILYDPDLGNHPFLK